jgi:hypothetical protein
MKTEDQQSATLTATTSGLTDPRMAVLIQATDPADKTTWVESPNHAGANRPALTFGPITLDDAGNKQTRPWPASLIELDCVDPLTPIRLAICEGTGPLATAGRRVSDNAFNIGTVPAGGKLRVPANSQSSSEQ